MLLMHRDTVVYDIKTDRVFNEKLMPSVYTGSNRNTDIIRWLKDRAIPLSRHNADKIYSAAGLIPGDNEIELIKLTHGASVNDNYWVKPGKEFENIA